MKHKIWISNGKSIKTYEQHKKFAKINKERVYVKWRGCVFQCRSDGGVSDELMADFSEFFKIEATEKSLISWLVSDPLRPFLR